LTLPLPEIPVDIIARRKREKKTPCNDGNQRYGGIPPTLRPIAAKTEHADKQERKSAQKERDLKGRYGIDERK
jgi:hypothetical protein